MMYSHRFSRSMLAMILSIGLLFAVFGTASAHVNHAKVLSSDPGIGSTIAQAPNKVTVKTAENINPDPAKSNLFVFGPNGDMISQGDAKVPLSNPSEMSVDIKPGGDGVYIVRWITVSAADGDPDEGAFVFTVNSSVSNLLLLNTPLWTPITVGVVAILAGLGAGLFLGRSRRSTRTTIGTMRKNLQTEQTEEATSQRSS